MTPTVEPASDPPSQQRAATGALQFSPDGFALLMDQANRYGYSCIVPGEDAARALLLRHDVDLSLRAAARLAQAEAALGVRATYFIMARSNFYDITSAASARELHTIVDCGHALGLHWDAGLYASTGTSPAEAVEREIDLLQWMSAAPCIAVSHHQPSLHGLAEIDLSGVVNMYGSDVQEKFAYVSDSCMSFRSDPEEVMASGQPLHLLLHPEYWAPGGSGLAEVTEALAAEECQVVQERFEGECALMLETVRRRSEFDGTLRASMRPKG